MKSSPFSHQSSLQLRLIPGFHFLLIASQLTAFDKSFPAEDGLLYFAEFQNHSGRGLLSIDINENQVKQLCASHDKYPNLEKDFRFYQKSTDACDGKPCKRLEHIRFLLDLGEIEQKFIVPER